MNRKEIENLTKDIVTPITNDYDFELVDVEFVKEGPHRYLRIYIDKPGGINIDDCQKVSQQVSDKLDEIDPIEDNFFLEVSSPGIDRPLKTDDDFNRAIGDDVEISLYSALNGKKKLEGNLKSFDNDNVLIEVENKETIKIERSTISRINLAVKF